MLNTKASPICSRRIVDIGTIDDEVPLSGVCNFLRFRNPTKRYAQCDSVAPDVQRAPKALQSPAAFKVLYGFFREKTPFPLNFATFAVFWLFIFLFENSNLSSLLLFS